MNSNQRSIQSAQSQSRLRIFALVALHAFPSTLLVYGAPFFAKALFHWESGQIALVQTLAGVGIMLGAWLGGQITHRTRPRYAMLGGILSCLLSALLGFSAGNEANATGFTVALALFGFGQAIAWPAIETALMEGQPHSKIQNLVGFYNLDWALVSAVAFFIATPLMHSFGLSSLFLLPAALYLLTLLYILFVIPITSPPPIDVLSPTQPATTKAPEARLSAQDRRLFRYLGWLSNPLSYLAINVIVVYNPAIQTRLHLDFATATIWLSLWFYFRTFGFELFRRWTGWRYDWRLLCGVYLLTLVSFGGIVFAPNLAVLVLAQAVFGVSLGLIYQSSLYYSMAGSEAQGEHGGWHEVYVGLGLTSGTLIAYLCDRFFPTQPAFPLFSVIGVMLVGLVALILIGSKTQKVA